MGQFKTNQEIEDLIKDIASQHEQFAGIKPNKTQIITGALKDMRTLYRGKCGLQACEFILTKKEDD